MKRFIWALVASLALSAGLASAQAYPGTKALVVCDMTERPFSLDPFKNLDGKVSFALRHVLGPWIDRDGEHRLVPGIFTTWRSTSPTTWEFGMRADLVFPDGTRASAEDAVYSIGLAIAKGSALASEFGSIDSARVLAADRVELRTKAPDPTLPARFANRPFLVERAEHVNLGPAYFDRPLGAWAYKVSAVDDQAMVLERNPRFPDRPTGMSAIVYRFIKDPLDRIAALKEGEIDLLSEITPTMNLEVAKDPRLQVVKVRVAQYVALFLNALADRKGIFADSGLREFMHNAIDAKRVIALAANGNGFPLATISMPEEFGFNASLLPRDADPARAQRLLDEWKARSGASSLSLRIASVDYLENIAKSVQGQLARYGVTVEVVLLPRGDVIAKVMQRKEIPVDAFIVDPQDPLLDSAFQLNIEANPSYPTAFFSTGEIASLLARANTEMDPVTRADLLGKAQAQLHSSFGPVPLYQKIALYGVSRKVKGFKPLADIYLRLEDVSVER